MTGCWKTPEEQRLKRREVLYQFTHEGNDCTKIWGKGGIKNTTPEKIMETLSKSQNNLGYITISNKHLVWDMPWPFENIDEKVTVEEKPGLITIKGSENFEMRFTASAIDSELSVVQVEGIVCKSMPYFIKENILSSCIKKIVKSVRDTLE